MANTLAISKSERRKEMKLNDDAEVNPLKVDGFMKVSYGDEGYFKAVKVSVNGVEFFVDCGSTGTADEIFEKLQQAVKGW